LSTREIAKRVGYHQCSVVRLLKKFRESGRVSRKKGSGRKPMSTPCQDRYLMRMCLRDRQASSVDLKNAWEAEAGVQVSAVTVRRRLFRAGLRARRPRKKPLLTAKMRTARLKWVKEYGKWTMQQWKSVIFSDESKFNLHGSDGQQYVRRRKGEEFQPQCVVPTVKFPVSQMIWGCISYAGVGRLHLVEGTVKAQQYIGILDKKLLPTIRDHFQPDERHIFQDDSAPCHRAHAVKQWLANKSIECLPWPGNSPDLNPIENCWKIVGAKLSRKKPKTLHELKLALIRIWFHEITPDYIQNLIASMPSRCRAVLKAKGGSTKY
jgi:transposase